MTRLANLKRKWIQDPAFKAEYDALEDEFALIRALIDARARAGLTQAELAERMGTTQSAIARMEGGRVNPSIGMLRRYAEATGTRLRLRLDEA
ncbi:MAG: XRE family transcriptional regulator [Gammaproteobacteria bacterium]|nr:MAG: XRE family transcriptional regulator [Gammaproteobacteria bacterium]